MAPMRTWAPHTCSHLSLARKQNAALARLVGREKKAKKVSTLNKLPPLSTNSDWLGAGANKQACWRRRLNEPSCAQIHRELGEASVRHPADACGRAGSIIWLGPSFVFIEPHKSIVLQVALRARCWRALCIESMRPGAMHIFFVTLPPNRQVAFASLARVFGFPKRPPARRKSAQMGPPNMSRRWTMMLCDDDVIANEDRLYEYSLPLGGELACWLAG